MTEAAATGRKVTTSDRIKDIILADGLRPGESITGEPQGAGNRVRISATAEPGP